MKPTLLRRNIIFVAGAMMLELSLVVSTFGVIKVLSAPLAEGSSTVPVPDEVGFEGFLADDNGNPVQPDGAYSLTFRIWDDEQYTEPSHLKWSESHQDVQVTKGLYSVQLGSVTTFTVGTFDGNRWIGVTANITGTAVEISPRTKINSVPFALNGEHANSAENVPWEGVTGKPTIITGSGMAGHVPKWSNSSTLANGIMQDTGSAVQVAGTITATGNITVTGDIATSGGVNAGSATGASAGQVFASDHVSQLLPFGTYVDHSPMTAGANPYAVTVDKAVTVYRWTQAWYVATTNNGTNYWTIYLKDSAQNTLASFTTASGSANTWTRKDNGALSISVTTDMVMIYITVAKNGSPGPGALYLAGPAVYAY